MKYCDWCDGETEVGYFIKTDEGYFCSDECALRARMAATEEDLWMWRALR